ncbi:Fc.00g037820.m01.CDS01 [Cosmosporella sp. VM-42]
MPSLHEQRLAENVLVYESSFSNPATSLELTPPNSHSAKRRRSNPLHSQDDTRDRSCDLGAKRRRTLDVQQPSPTLTFPPQLDQVDVLLPSPRHVTTTKAPDRFHAQRNPTFEDILGDLEASGLIQEFQNATDNPQEAPAIDCTSGEYEETDIDELLGDFYQTAEVVAAQNTSSPPDMVDEFNFSDSDEAEFAQLAEPPSHQEPDRPPSSIIRGFDSESRSDNEFDPNLQYSSPRRNSSLTQTALDESSMEAEVDWEPVRKKVPRQPEATPFLGSQDTGTVFAETPSPLQCSTIVREPQLSVATTLHRPSFFIGKMLLKPFKTFFSLQEMLETKGQMYKNQPEIIFELFSRVSYSSRENFLHKQHFQFRDLLKESPPFLNGTLSG